MMKRWFVETSLFYCISVWTKLKNKRINQNEFSKMAKRIPQTIIACSKLPCNKTSIKNTIIIKNEKKSAFYFENFFLVKIIIGMQSKYIYIVLLFI